MDFFDQEAHAQKQTRRLLWLFSLAVLSVVFLAYFIFTSFAQIFEHPVVPENWWNPMFLFCTAFLIYGTVLAHPIQFLESSWSFQIFFWSTIGTLTLIAAGCLYKMRLLAGGGSAVAEMLGGRQIEDDPADLKEKQLRDVVAEMAIASGMSMPEIYVLDCERGINSFAAGHTREDVAIGVTFGAMKLLTRDELQGVVAHEFSHVLNGDTRLNMKLMALAHGLSWPTIVGRVLVRGSAQPLGPDDSIFDPDSSPTLLPTAPIGILFLIMGSISSPFVRFIKSMICREREWLADAAAVQFTRNPAGIEGAFKKIGGLLKQGRMDSPYAEVASHLYFANSAFDPWFGFMSTHPPLPKRILAVDPAFDGQFHHIMSLPRQPLDDSQKTKGELLYEENVRRAREQAQTREELE
ncbi:MAG TPA: M48 family metalloprotease [Verrucomicrobiae bacterium]|jgi:Zn-dependent protease with chaperone function